MKIGGKVTNHSNNASVKKPVNNPSQIAKYFRFERTRLEIFASIRANFFSGPCEDWFLTKTNSRWRREARRTTADYNGIEEP